jgi:hypothetical protein
MSEVNFCPFCDAPQHKLMLCKKDLFFCKLCNRFFKLNELDVKCQRCKGQYKKSDFPSPSGEAVFFCVKCKRTFPASEILEDIK